MKPAPFDYYKPDTSTEVVSLLHDNGADVKILAGGQSLVPMLNMRLLSPKVLVDITLVKDLNFISEQKSWIEIGAAVTQAQLMEYLETTDAHPLLKQVMPWIGHAQTRAKGTVCGSLVHSDPSSELPLCLKMLDGEIVLRSKKGKRIVKAHDFQTGLLETDVREDELVVAVRFPKRDSQSHFSFREISHRHGDFAIIAIAVELSAEAFRLCVGGIADVPTVVTSSRMSRSSLKDFLNEFAWELGGSDDVHATARYRRELVRQLGLELILEAVD